MDTLIKNATLINEDRIYLASLLIKDNKIHEIYYNDTPLPEVTNTIDGEGSYLLPGVIDDQVHFREPGLTHKGDLYTESRAAVAGGVTSYMEMPNTLPQTTAIEALQEKFAMAAGRSLANYSFYLGATNENLKELLKADPASVCGIKVFMGSSTGNMLVDNKETLKNIFKEVPMLIATHCEDEDTIKRNIEKYKIKYGESIPFRYHPCIRSEEACYKSSSLAVELASKYDARLHILHLSTARELSLLSNSMPLKQKKITGEVCVHHLWFSDKYYDQLGARIKWNPAIKTLHDREALREALRNNTLDVVATDHAPHTLEEKNNPYIQSPSGGPLVQHSLLALLELNQKDIFSKKLIVEKMCHAPALLFGIKKRGFIRKGYYADLVLVKPGVKDEVSDQTVLYKCKWSPLAGTTFSHRVTHTWVNGHLAFENGTFHEEHLGKALVFER